MRNAVGISAPGEVVGVGVEGTSMERRSLRRKARPCAGRRYLSLMSLDECLHERMDENMDRWYTVSKRASRLVWLPRKEWSIATASEVQDTQSKSEYNMALE